jgi:Fur family ferric uptake transcriptional regulator
MSTDLDFFKEYLSKQGLKFTRQRQAIAEVFLATETHPSLIEILELTKKRHKSVGYATIYRTMKLMTECGLATEHRFGEGDHARYEPNVEGEHHDHLICLACGKIMEFENDEIERLQDEVAQAFEFKVAWHRHEIYGYCSKPTCVPSP